MVLVVQVVLIRPKQALISEKTSKLTTEIQPFSID